VGPKERDSAKLRNASALLWTAYLIAMYALPERWLYWPTIKAIDWSLWPIVRGAGKVWTVAIVAAALAALTMLCQRLLTDNARLLEGKRRARQLSREAAKLPKDSKRRITMEDLAAGVQMRVAVAAFVPLAVLLGPLVMSCIWLPNRVAPEAWNANPGTTATVVATVDSDVRRPLTLELREPLRLDETTAASQTLPLIRETLQRLAKQWQQNSDLSALPWELREAGRRAGQASLAELQTYLLKDTIPPQALSWTIRPAEQAAGRFPIVLRVGDQVAVTLWAVFGEQYPPDASEVAGEAGVVWAKIIYAKPEHRRVFWAPLARMGLAHWDAGWMITYLLAYLPAMFLFRRIFNVA
jgi:uncharacterized membrane protein (DUF106 family)